MTEMTRRLGLNALATLPLWCAIGAVLLLARDLSEVAAAAIAAAGLVTVLGMAAIAVVIRRAGRATREHDNVVRQSLALIDCMKEINRRLMDVEAGAAAPAAMRITEQLAMPAAGNDAGSTQAADGAADRAADRAADGAAPDAPCPCGIGGEAEPDTAESDPAAAQAMLAQPAAVADPLPAHEPLSSPPARPAWRTVPVLTLADFRTVSRRFESDGADAADALAVIEAGLAALEQGRGPVEIVLPVPLTDGGDALLRLAAAVSARRERARDCLLGLDASDLRAGGAPAALLVARLTRLGVRLSLHGLHDCALSPEALVASGVARVGMDAAGLLRAFVRDPDRMTAWISGLAAADVALAAEAVENERVAAMLAALGVPLGVGPGIAPGPPAAEPAPPLPWLARRRG